MFTRRRPTENEFAEGSNLHKYVETALPDRAIDVIDQHSLSATEDDEGRTQDNQTVDTQNWHDEGFLDNLGIPLL